MDENKSFPEPMKYKGETITNFNQLFIKLGALIIKESTQTQAVELFNKYVGHLQTCLKITKRTAKSIARDSIGICVTNCPNARLERTFAEVLGIYDPRFGKFGFHNYANNVLSRIPYGVKCKIDLDRYLAWNETYAKKFEACVKIRPEFYDEIKNGVYQIAGYPCSGKVELYGFNTEDDLGVPIEFIKMYLRPIDTITDCEVKELRAMYIKASNEIVQHKKDDIAFVKNVELDARNTAYCCERHLDYNNLIGEGLALPAPEGMYKLFNIIV